MKKKLLLSTALMVALAYPTVSMAEDGASNAVDLPGEFSGSFSIVTDYAFRGITQSDENPALQGSLDWSNELDNGIGVYSGIWASSVDFNDGSEASTEFDFYAGLTFGTEDLTFDLGGIYYAYPGATKGLDYDFWEAQAIVGYDFDVASVAASINYSPENFGDSGDAEYYKLSAEAPLPNDFSLTAHIGRQNVEDNVTFGVPDYTDWSIGLGYAVEGFDLGLQYVDTDLSETECADGCDGKAIFSVSKSF